MEKPDVRNWTANIVIAFDDYPLKDFGRALEDEIRFVLARIDDPLEVVDYINFLRRESEVFRNMIAVNMRDK